MIVLGATAPGVAGSAELDGSTPILCVVMGATECDRWGLCDAVDGSSMGLPPFVRVNVGGKALEATDGSGRKTVIHSSTLAKEPPRLILQGGDAGPCLEPRDRSEDGRDDGGGRRPRRRLPDRRHLHAAIGRAGPRREASVVHGTASAAAREQLQQQGWTLHEQSEAELWARR